MDENGRRVKKLVIVHRSRRPLSWTELDEKQASFFPLKLRCHRRLKAELGELADGPAGSGPTKAVPGHRTPQMLRIGVYTEPKALLECGGLTPLFDSRAPARRKKMSFKLRTACAQKREVWEYDLLSIRNLAA